MHTVAIPLTKEKSYPTGVMFELKLVCFWLSWVQNLTKIKIRYVEFITICFSIFWCIEIFVWYIRSCYFFYWGHYKSVCCKQLPHIPFILTFSEIHPFEQIYLSRRNYIWKYAFFDFLIPAVDFQKLIQKDLSDVSKSLSVHMIKLSEHKSKLPLYTLKIWFTTLNFTTGTFLTVCSNKL